MLPEHESDLRSFIDYARRFRVLFLVLVPLLTAAMVIFALVEHVAAVGISVVITGVVAMVLPFATPHTVEMLGLSKSIRLARILGGITAVIGLILAGGFIG